MSPITQVQCSGGHQVSCPERRLIGCRVRKEMGQTGKIENPAAHIRA